MADRSVVYTFKGQFGSLTSGLAVAGKATGDLGTKLTGLDKQGATSRRGLTQLGSTAGRMGLIAAAGVGAIVLAAANFDQAMSNVAATGQDARNSLDDLREAAIKAGAATKFSASEAAAAEEALAKAGVSAADVLGGGLAGSLDLAAAGGLEVADAAEIAATALTQFKLAGEDVPHVADLLAAGAGKAQGDVSDLAMALKQGGLVAAQMGISIEETTGVLAEFASAGLLGSDAGTSLKTMLLRLANPSAESAKLMTNLGIAAYDAQGNFVGLESLAGQLTTAFEGKTQAERDSALATIFGSDAIRAASVLYQGGAKDVADWTAKVDDSGFAAETAAIKMDNLKGDLEQLKGSLETALIGAGGGAQGPLRSLVQGLTSAVNMFNELPGPAKSTVTALGAITAITGGGLWFGSKVVSGVANTKKAMEDLGVSAEKTKGAMKGIGAAAAGLVVLDAVGASVTALEKKFDKAVPSTEKMTKALLDLGNAKTAQQLGEDIGDLGDAVDRLNAGGLTGATDKLADMANEGGILGNVLKGVNVASGNMALSKSQKELREYAASIEAVDSALANIVTTGSPDQAREAFAALAAAQGLSKDQQSELLKLLPQYSDALDGDANSADLAAGANDGLAASTSAVGEESKTAAEEIQGLVEAMVDQKNAALDAFGAETAYRQAMKDATAQAKKSNAGIKGNSDAVLENRNQLESLIGAWNNQSAVVTDNIGKFKAARDNFITTAAAMGVPREAAKKLWQEMAKIPESQVIPVSLQAEAAIAKAKTLKEILAQIKSKDINIAVHYLGIQNKPHPGTDTGDASSGRTSGGLNLRTPSTQELNGTKEAYAAQALGLLAKNSDDAAKGAKGLKEKLHDAEQKLNKFTRKADEAADALQSLRDQRSDLVSSVSGSLSNDPFGGNLAEFNTVTNADTAAAQAVLAALQTLVANGLDPHSDLFKRLAASGNVKLIQEFAALSASSLAAEAASFAAGQGAFAAVGQFAGDAAFNDLIAAQAKVTNKLDNTVDRLAERVHGLEKAIDAMAEKVKKGSHDGSESGSEAGGKKVAEAILRQMINGYVRAS